MNENEQKGAKKLVLALAQRVKQAVKDHEKCSKTDAKAGDYENAIAHREMASMLRSDGPLILADVYEAEAVCGYDGDETRTKIREIIRGGTGF